MKMRHLLSVLFAAAMTAATVSAVEAAKIKSNPPPTKDYFYISSVMADGGKHQVWDQPGYPDRYQKGAEFSMFKFEVRKYDQQFKFVADGDGWYHIVTNNGGGAVTIKGNKDENGARLVIWDYDKNAANQKFCVQYQGGGKYKIFTSYGRCVTLANRSSQNGSALVTWDNHDGDWMLWVFIDTDITMKPYYPKESGAGSSDGNAKNYGTLKDAISGTKIGEQYFSRVSAADFESENSGKIFQTWANGLSRNDQLGVYSDVLANSINSPAAASIFKALSEVSFKPGKGFVDGVGNNALRKQYTDAAGRQKNAAVRAQIEAAAAKIK